VPCEFGREPEYPWRQKQTRAQGEIDRIDESFCFPRLLEHSDPLLKARNALSQFDNSLITGMFQRFPGLAAQIEIQVRRCQCGARDFPLRTRRSKWKSRLHESLSQ